MEVHVFIHKESVMWSSKAKDSRVEHVPGKLMIMFKQLVWLTTP